MRELTPMAKSAERWDFKLRLLMTGLYLGLELLAQGFWGYIGIMEKKMKTTI